MTEYPRRQVAALIAQYTLEPEVRDIYVEGRRDQVFFAWLMRRLGLPRTIATYEVQTIDLPSSLLKQHGLSRPSNHDRVVGLALELDAKLTAPHRHVTCIADLEMDHVLDRRRSSPHLIYTDVTSPEMFAYSERVLEKFFAVVLGGFPIDPKAVLTQLGGPLLMRALAVCANESLGWSMKRLQSTASIRIEPDGTCLFDQEQFIRSYLSGNAKLGQLNIFLDEMARLEPRAKADLPRAIPGHDYTQLLALYIKRFLPKNLSRFQDAATLEAAIMGCVEAEDLLSHPGMAELVRRMK